uniref:NADH:ubiquinone oxidoreductase intermediate-associated protein 30 domain-containing protein n=1 Tax=Globisporangium ultimum (strain ATCC 200006 / CBS 805.95 / DAOM BR144) TaxID=431595 RepID=K3WI04_GLOUD
MSFLRKAVASVESAILTSKQSLGLQLKLQQERDVFLFRNRDATRDWIASSDRSIGGLSECKWGFYGDSGEKLHPEDKRGLITSVHQEDNIPSAVFSGRLSMACQPTEAGVIRSGYCAVRTPMPAGLLLHGYEGITMRIMTDGREMNAQMDSWNPLNLYMGFIRTPANEWVDIELPFKSFMLTSKGYYKFDDNTTLDPSKLRSIGFAIADQKEGDFELRVQWIKAVAQLENPGKDRDDEEDDDTYDDAKVKPGFKKPSDLVI